MAEKQTDKKQTHKNEFDAKQIKTLKANKYVDLVTSATVRFSREFRVLFIRERRSGKKPKQIFKDAGIEPEVLGISRIKSYSSNVMKKWNDMSIGQLGSYTEQLEREKKCAEEEIEIIRQIQQEKMAEASNRK